MAVTSTTGAISSPGLGSGLDVNGIVSKLMAVESQPLVALQKQEQKVTSQISAYGTLRSVLDKFKTAMGALSTTSNFELYKATAGDTGVFGASASSTAKAGSYNVTVDRLAQAHKMSSGEFASTTKLGGGDAADALDFTVGTQSFSVNIFNGGAGMTLSQISDAINANTSNTTVAATVINGNSGNQKLVLTSKSAGAASQIQLSYAGLVTPATLNLATTNLDPGGAQMVDLTQLDAAIKVDGYAVTRSTNSISDVITGVTLDLKAKGSTTLDVARDNTAVTSAVQGFVNSYNDVQKTVNSLRNGDLQGDTTLNSIISRLRSVLNTPVASGTYKTLGEVGILTNRADGTLQLNSTTLTKTLTTDFPGVAALFGNATDGVAKRLNTVATDMLQAGNGLIDNRTQGLNKRVSILKAREDSMSYRLTLIENNYRQQFNALDTFVSKMNATSASLTSQLASLMTSN